MTDNYELRRVDSLNWRMYERRGVKKRESKGGKRTGEVLTEWVALDCFPRTIESACAWIRLKQTADDLKHAVERAVRR